MEYVGGREKNKLVFLGKDGAQSILAIAFSPMVRS